MRWWCCDEIVMVKWMSCLDRAYVVLAGRNLVASSLELLLQQYWIHVGIHYPHDALIMGPDFHHNTEYVWTEERFNTHSWIISYLFGFRINIEIYFLPHQINIFCIPHLNFSARYPFQTEIIRIKTGSELNSPAPHSLGSAETSICIISIKRSICRQTPPACREMMSFVCAQSCECQNAPRDCNGESKTKVYCRTSCLPAASDDTKKKTNGWTDRRAKAGAKNPKRFTLD